MKLLSVPLARSLWFLDTAEINPRGTNIFTDLIPALIEAYEFKQFPKEGEDFKDGMKFGLGTFTNSAENEVQVGLAIYGDGLAADTYSTTKDSDEFLEQVGKLLINVGYTFDPSMVRRKSYLSQVVVRCERQLSALNPKLEAFAKRIADAGGGKTTFDCAVLEFWPDQTRSNKPANFSFQNRAGDAFDDDRYWSQAALPTEKHIELLQELEAILA
jgi:hypothetical protein